MNNRWLKIRAATEYAGLSRNTLMCLIDSGHIKARKRPVGGWIVDRRSIDDYNNGSEDEEFLFNDLMTRVG
jgi:predicted site-specific integrase-resolvase